MSKVKANLVKVNLNAGNYKLAVLIALRMFVENNNTVYLPNAYDMVKDSLTKHQFAGYLSALESDGVYRPSEHSEGFFGQVDYK